MAVENLRTVGALQNELKHVPVTAGQLRWWIFNAEQNGLEAALVRRAGRVFIDRQGFERWMLTGSAKGR